MPPRSPVNTTAAVRLKSCSDTRVAPVMRSGFSDRTSAGETSHASHDGGTIGTDTPSSGTAS